MIHPALALPYDDVLAGLREAKADGLVNEHVGEEGLRLFCYTKTAVFDRVWTPFTRMARGVIIDVERGEVVALPFPKFFNVGETAEPIPDMPFEVFEKVDGSLIIIFHHNGRWKAATKGSLCSDQAKWATARLNAQNGLSAALLPGVTYLAEAIYPENRIVIRYDETGLVLLGGYDEDGYEIPFEKIEATGRVLGWRCAKRHSFGSISDLISHASSLPATEEGFVIRFADGLRLKVKGDEYRRIHSLISRCTPLAVWEAMSAGDDLAAMKRDLPEEFWADFDTIRSLLQEAIGAIRAEVAAAAGELSGRTDKDVGLMLGNLSPNVRSFIFAYRKTGDLMTGKARQNLFRTIRPSANRLDGYEPSSSMSRVLEESA